MFYQYSILKVDIVRFLFVYSFVFILSINLFAQTSDNNIEQKIQQLIKQLTLEEKIDLLGGTGFETKPIDRLGIPSLKMTDGPLGVRWNKATAFPSGILMAATFNPDLIEQVGKAIAIETKAKGRNVILAPCVNIARIPMGGRNFESFGEDPYLASRMTVSYIKGVQSENVVATVKHFAANNQEHQRMFVDVQVDKRTLNEIYFPAFKAAVKEANVLAVMAAYNKVNGFYCSDNKYLLKTTLKNKWNFRGLVMSDWGAVHSTELTFKNGLDLEMPDGKFLNRKTLLHKIKNGELSEDELNDKISRLLRIMFKIDLFDKYKYDSTKVNTIEHQNLALEVAKEGMVLLKNENYLLPLDLSKINSLAVIGPTSNVAIYGGGGSSMVSPIKTVSPLEALQNKIGDKVKINFDQGDLLMGFIQIIKPEFLYPDRNGKENGLKGEYFDNIDLKGYPKRARIDKNLNFDWENEAPFPDFSKDFFSVRWTGYIKVDKSGKYLIQVSSDDGVRLFIDDKLVIDNWNDHAELTNSYPLTFTANKFYKIKLEYYERSGAAICRFGLREQKDDLITQAVKTAKKSDVTLVFVGTNFVSESEGFDRKDLFLPGKQEQLIDEISKVNKNTIVILTTGSPVLMNNWIDKVPAVLQTWFGGEQIGNAIADILLGNTNPSCKLPITFPIQWEDCSAFKTYTVEDGVSRYNDQIFVGYRHFDKYNIEPLFPFGFGLSYSTFEFSDLKVSKNNFTQDEQIEISCKVKNTGTRTGKEVVQLYIIDLKSSLPRPVKELKRFSKIELNPGESKEIRFILNSEDFKFFEPDIDDWKLESGEFKIMIGNSSRDIKLSTNIFIE